jgi:hypothetical protein
MIALFHTDESFRKSNAPFYHKASLPSKPIWQNLSRRNSIQPQMDTDGHR